MLAPFLDLVVFDITSRFPGRARESIMNYGFCLAARFLLKDAVSPIVMGKVLCVCVRVSSFC